MASVLENDDFNDNFSFEKYLTQISESEPIMYVGYVTAVNGLEILSKGPIAQIGEICTIKLPDGKTILSTGQGASPEYVLNYLLEKNGVNATVEFKSEATEVAAALATDPTQIAVLPQPFVTVAEGKNDALHTAFSLTDEWAKVSDSQLLTGVTVVRNDFLAENKEAVDQFLADHASSVEAVNGDAEAASKLIAQYGIIEKAPIAQKALPQCNIVCITGEEMKADLSAYLQVLYDADPSSVGGSLPDDAFYYAQ